MHDNAALAGFSAGRMGCRYPHSQRYSYRWSGNEGDGEPVIGATVRELNTSNATITDIDGNFTMKLTSKKPVLEISYIGYKTVKVPVTGPTVNVTMEIESTDLDEVVVVAYGQQVVRT